MKKLAVFVEGQTEQLFVEKLIREITSANDIEIVKSKLTGGGRNALSFIRLWTSSSSSEREYFILIIDCSGDTTVKSYVRDNYENLVSNGYSSIIAIRDVYPQFKHEEIGRLRSGLMYGMKTNPIRVAFVLGVMEIETWFICEYTHFIQLDSSLTVDHIKTNLGFDPSVDDMQLLPIPSIDLDNIYRLVEKRYKKDYSHIMRLLNRLDYARLYFDIPQRLPDLKLLVESINIFLMQIRCIPKLLIAE